MKAAVYREYGPPHDVIEIENIDMPRPKSNEVLLRVKAASVNPIDSHVMTTIIGRLMNGFRRPRQPVPGIDASGIVEAIGDDVTRFKVGDPVFGSCEGAFAEFARAKETKLAIRPGNVTDEQAASLPIAGLTALQALRDAAKLSPGQRVVVNGASGGVGTFGVQIAKLYGAEVTGVCSTRNVEMVRDIGADMVIDYTKDDFTRNGQPYDVIFDLAGNRPLSEYRRALKPKGIYIGAGMLGKEVSIPDVIGGLLGAAAVKPFASQKIISFLARVVSDDLAKIAELVGSGKIRPVIDRRYRLEETADAIEYVRTKRACGKVVINVS